MVYSTYCNSYPRALMELETYTGNSEAMTLLERYVCNQSLIASPVWFANNFLCAFLFFLLSRSLCVCRCAFDVFDCYSCRTQQSLPELPLSAHLLAPIQRICRYPLHLSELVKHSLSKQDLMRLHEDDDHVDIDTLDTKETFEQALAAMKRVTEMVNEGNFYTDSFVECRFSSIWINMLIVCAIFFSVSSFFFK